MVFKTKTNIRNVGKKFMLKGFVKTANQATINAFRAGKKFIKGPKNGF